MQNCSLITIEALSVGRIDLQKWRSVLDIKTNASFSFVGVLSSIFEWLVFFWGGEGGRGLLYFETCNECCSVSVNSTLRRMNCHGRKTQLAFLSPLSYFGEWACGLAFNIPKNSSAEWNCLELNAPNTRIVNAVDNVVDRKVLISGIEVWSSIPHATDCL